MPYSVVTAQQACSTEMVNMLKDKEIADEAAHHEAYSLSIMVVVI